LFGCALAARRASVWAWFCAGLVLGTYSLVRPNAVTLLPALILVGLISNAPYRSFAVLIVSALIAFMGLSFAATGKPNFWPENGGYNLFAGNNPFSLAEIRRNHHAEGTLEPALAWCGINAGPYQVKDEEYVTCAFRFAVENPAEALRVTLYKAYTMLFRPNLRLADTRAKAFAQYLILLPTVAWWMLMLGSRSFRASHPGIASIIFLLLYSTPFIITNADPRFRIPLDVVYAMSALSYALGDRHPWRKVQT
jgi:hypothetical protein